MEIVDVFQLGRQFVYRLRINIAIACIGKVVIILGFVEMDHPVRLAIVVEAVVLLLILANAQTVGGISKLHTNLLFFQFFAIIESVTASSITSEGFGV